MNSKFLELTGMKVVSSGQVGVEIAALRVAQCLGIRTGGYSQRNFNTLIGPQPTLKHSFKCEEYSGGYSNHIKTNIRSGDASLIIASNIESEETKTAIEYSKYIDYPYKVIELSSVVSHPHPKYDYPKDTIKQVVEWLNGEMKGKDPFTLNVVGNNSKTSPGIFIPSFMMLTQIFHKVQLRVCEENGIQLDENIKHLASQVTNVNVAQSLADNYQHIVELYPRL